MYKYPNALQLNTPPKLLAYQKVRCKNPPQPLGIGKNQSLLTTIIPTNSRFTFFDNPSLPSLASRPPLEQESGRTHIPLTNTKAQSSTRHFIPSCRSVNQSWIRSGALLTAHAARRVRNPNG